MQQTLNGIGQQRESKEEEEEQGGADDKTNQKQTQVLTNTGPAKTCASSAPWHAGKNLAIIFAVWFILHGADKKSSQIRSTMIANDVQTDQPIVLQSIALDAEILYIELGLTITYSVYLIIMYAPGLFVKLINNLGIKIKSRENYFSGNNIDLSSDEKRLLNFIQIVLNIVYFPYGMTEWDAKLRQQTCGLNLPKMTINALSPPIWVASPIATCSTNDQVFASMTLAFFFNRFIRYNLIYSLTEPALLIIKDLYRMRALRDAHTNWNNSCLHKLLTWGGKNIHRQYRKYPIDKRTFVTWSAYLIVPQLNWVIYNSINTTGLKEWVRLLQTIPNPIGDLGTATTDTLALYRLTQQIIYSLIGIGTINLSQLLLQPAIHKICHRTTIPAKPPSPEDSKLLNHDHLQTPTWSDEPINPYKTVSTKTVKLVANQWMRTAIFHPQTIDVMKILFSITTLVYLAYFIAGSENDFYTNKLVNLLWTMEIETDNPNIALPDLMLLQFIASLVTRTIPISVSLLSAAGSVTMTHDLIRGGLFKCANKTGLGACAKALGKKEARAMEDSNPPPLWSSELRRERL